MLPTASCIRGFFRLVFLYFRLDMYTFLPNNHVGGALPTQLTKLSARPQGTQRENVPRCTGTRWCPGNKTDRVCSARAIPSIFCRRFGPWVLVWCGMRRCGTREGSRRLRPCLVTLPLFCV